MMKTVRSRVWYNFITWILIFVLTFGNWCVLGEWVVSEATSSALELQDDATKSKNVKFNIGIEEEKQLVYSKKADINDVILLKSYISVENQGYLKDAYITFEGESGENKNFDIIEIKQEDDVVRASGANKIELNQITENNIVNLEFVIQYNREVRENLDRINQNNIVKLVATYVDGQGKEIKIEKPVILNIEWVCENEIEVTTEVTRYTEYELPEEKGIVITQNIQIAQTNSEAMPYKKIEVNAEQIKIQDKKADEIIVKSGNRNVDFEILDNDIIKITDTNTEQNGFIEIKETNREYNVTYIFKNTEMMESLDINTKLNTEVSIYSSETVKTKELEYVASLNEKIGSVVEARSTNAGSISKGKLYANFNQAEPYYETTYEANFALDVAYKKGIKQIKIKDIGSYFENEENKKYEMQDETRSYVYYKSTKISKKNFEEILGADGNIKILDENDNQIAEISKETNLDEDGNYCITYEQKVSNISIITSEIVSEGSIEIKNEKVIEPLLPYEKEQVKNFKILENEFAVQLLTEDSNNTINLANISATTELQESKTEAIFELGINKLSSISKNENVEIKIELKNNEETSDLYKNPRFEIEFPEEISSINIKEANVLFDEELQIESINKTKKDGKIVLEVKLKGTQSKFLLKEYINGTTIVLNTDIEVDVRTSSKTEKVTMKYYNENVVQYNSENYGEYSNSIEFISPIGMIIGTELKNYNSDGSSIMSVLQGEKTGKLEIYTDAKNANTNILVINNTGNNCDNFTILGRLPFKGNKNIITGEELGTTINTKLTDVISVESKFENVDIYYTDKEEANTDLSVIENNWTKDITSLENVKSYMIKINGIIEQSDIINISYNFEIPANLEHNTYIYQDVVAFYNNNREVAKVEETAKPDIMCLTTGRGPQMEITQTASIPNGGEAYEGQKIKYSINVKNTGIDPIYNLKIRDILPNNAIYTVYTRNGLLEGYDEKNPNAKILEWNIEEVGIEQTINVEFEVEVNKLPSIEEYYSQNENFVQENGKYYIKENDTLTEITELPTIAMKNQVIVNAKDLEKEIYAQDYENIVKSPEILVTETSSVSEEVLMKEENDLTYSIRIKNNKQEDINNIKLDKILPEGLEFKNIYTIKYNPEYEEWEKDIIGTYDANTRRASLNIGTINKDSDIHIKIEVKTGKLGEEEYSREVENVTKITGDNIGEYTGDIKKNTIAKPKLITEYICDNKNKYLTDGEIVEYSIKVTNISNISANNVNISDTLPEGLEFIKASYSVGAFSVTTTMDADRKIEATGNLLPNENMVLNIKAIATSKSQNINIENTASINSPELGSSQTDTVSHIVEATSQEGTISIPVEQRKYSITGKVWYDENRNGARDSEETTLPEIEIMAINSNTGLITQKTLTDKEGNYYINDLEKGNYLIICKYDNNKYQVAEYKKVGLSENNNSDAISVDIEENGERYAGAISDTIRINNEDYSNIDIGLVDKLIFDLKIDSGINKITMQNQEGIKEHNYENAKMATTAINPDLLDSTTAYIEYKITITNEGNVPGFANNIIDYMPTDVVFNSELNPSWYIGQDGNIYSNELANKIINPGETKEIKLILIKKMTEQNTGINVNKVEIYETYNELGLKDIDSVENNKSDTEDDYSQTTALITLQLGKAKVYTNVLLVIIILVGIIYYIDKHNIIFKDKNKKIYK